MRFVLLLMLVCGCTPRLALSVRRPAAVSLGPARSIAILTHDTRTGVVMRERVRFLLAPDAHYTLVPMCGERSCQPVDAFLRLYERQPQIVVTKNGQQLLSVVVETDVVSATSTPVLPKRERSRQGALGAEPPERTAERLASEAAAEFARELVHPASTEWLVFDHGAPFRLGVKQALDGRLADAQRTFEEMIANNPQTAGAYFNLALVLEARGDLARARTSYQQAMRLTDKAEYAEGFAAFERRQQAAAQLERLPQR